MAGEINIGKIQADLEVDSGNVERGLAAARQAMVRIERELKQLDEEFKKGLVTYSVYQQRVLALSDTMADLGQRMNAAYTAVTQVNTGLGVANASLAQSGSAARGAGYGWLLLGQAVEDSQYGFAAIQNNIPGIVYGLSGSQGLAGAASLASVAIMTWARNWEYVQQLGEGTTFFETMKSGFEGIADSALSALASVANFSGVTLKVGDVKADQAVRAERKEREKRGEAGLKAVGGIRGEGAEDRAQAFREAVETFGGGELVRKMIEDSIKNSGKTEAQQATMRTTMGNTLAGAMEGAAGAAEEIGAAVPGLGKLVTRRLRAHSPEQQERAIQAEEGMRLEEQERKQEEQDRKQEEQDRKQEEREAGELADLQMEELEESNKNRQRYRQEQKRKRAENTRRAKEEAPGIETEAMGFALQGMVAGLDKPETIAMVADQIRASLEEAGLTEKQAAAAAADIAKEGVGAAEERVVKGTYREGRERRSATIGLEGVSEHIQSGVGGKQDKTNNYLDAAVKYLAKIAQQDQDRFVLRIEP